MAAEISKSERPPAPTATANGAWENTGKVTARPAALQALKGQLYHEHFQEKKLQDSLNKNQLSVFS